VSAAQFEREEYGTLALAGAGGYFILGRSGCLNLNQAPGSLRFLMSHATAEPSQKTFAAAHVTLMKVGGRDPNSRYLFRNGTGWGRDRSGIPYSAFQRGPHEEFNDQLSGSEENFDNRYRDENRRTWNDHVEIDAADQSKLKFGTWALRDTFSVRSDLLDAASRNQVRVATQNYLIGFNSRKREDAQGVGSPPSFTVDARSADCLLIRVAGTSAFPQASAEYVVTFNNNETCVRLLGYRRASWW
jgi:hypothetical protein